ncbi:MAG: OmpA family protein [Pseudobdellovibrionaceae bacterium]
MKNAIKTKTLLFCTVALCFGGYSAHAQDPTSGPRYVPRASISNQNYTPTEHTQDRMDKSSYTQYEQREPCQNYRKLPRQESDRCVVAEEDVTLNTVELSPAKGLLPIVNSYTILFDFDKSKVRANEAPMIDRIISEISQYNPTQITVTGYTDSSGAADYNQQLSHLREQAVSKALLNRGIKNQAIDRDARGEFDQAVETPDNTRNQENRRVVVDFRR